MWNERCCCCSNVTHPQHDMAHVRITMRCSSGDRPFPRRRGSRNRSSQPLPLAMEGAGDKAWGLKPGSAWADEVDLQEAKRGVLADEEAFPSLGEAIKAPVAKTTKKPKAMKMDLGTFMAAGARRSALTDDEIRRALPKGSSGLPREEREAGALGGAFKEYGGNRDGAPSLGIAAPAAALHGSCS